VFDTYGLGPRDQNFQSFVGYGPTNGTSDTNWIQWRKPRGISSAIFYCIGGGAGGGGGFTRAPGAAGGGGGGGGPGAISRLFVSTARIIPDILYLLPGNFGVGGAANSSGQAGAQSYISVAPSTTAAFLLLTAQGGAATSTAGASGAGGSGGAQGTASAIANMPFAILGPFLSATGGAAGGAGATNGGAAGSSVAAMSSGILSGGAGGGGVTITTNAVSNGGNISTAGIIPVITGGTGNATTPTAGADGIWNWSPLSGTGGAGGGADGTAGTGGFGGKGAFGCGGGGGGAGVTGGSGGDGGAGLILIQCW
jgi:hypothetical protein